MFTVLLTGDEGIWMLELGPLSSAAEGRPLLVCVRSTSHLFSDVLRPPSSPQQELLPGAVNSELFLLSLRKSECH